MASVHIVTCSTPESYQIIAVCGDRPKAEAAAMGHMAMQDSDLFCHWPTRRSPVLEWRRVNEGMWKAAIFWVAIREHEVL